MFGVWKTEINKWNEIIFWKTNTCYSIIEETDIWIDTEMFTNKMIWTMW